MRRYAIYTNYIANVGTVYALISNNYPEQEVENGMYTESELPELKIIPNLDACLRIRLDTGELYYDYVARDTFENKVADLQQENAELKQAVAELTMLIAAAPTA